jgi:hypothetical protein
MALDIIYYSLVNLKSFLLKISHPFWVQIANCCFDISLEMFDKDLKFTASQNKNKPPVTHQNLLLSNFFISINVNLNFLLVA